MVAMISDSNTNPSNLQTLLKSAQEEMERKTVNESTQFDLLQSKASISLTICVGSIIVNFARPPENQALQIIAYLAKERGFSNLPHLGFSRLLVLTKLYDSKDVAEFLKTKFEAISMSTVVEISPGYLEYEKVKLGDES
jgi:hypothetical protein